MPLPGPFTQLMIDEAPLPHIPDPPLGTASSHTMSIRWSFRLSSLVFEERALYSRTPEAATLGR